MNLISEFPFESRARPISSPSASCSFLRFYIIYRNFSQDIVWLTMLLLFTFWVFGYNYKVFREGSRNKGKEDKNCPVQRLVINCGCSCLVAFIGESQKKAGSLSQKVIRSLLNEGDIISLRPDLREGTFSYYRVN